jgi:hypothetical protein
MQKTCQTEVLHLVIDEMILSHKKPAIETANNFTLIDEQFDRVRMLLNYTWNDSSFLLLWTTTAYLLIQADILPKQRKPSELTKVLQEMICLGSFLSA